MPSALCDAITRQDEAAALSALDCLERNSTAWRLSDILECDDHAENVMVRALLAQHYVLVSRLVRYEDAPLLAGLAAAARFNDTAIFGICEAAGLNLLSIGCAHALDLLHLAARHGAVDAFAQFAALCERMLALPAASNANARGRFIYTLLAEAVDSGASAALDAAISFLVDKAYSPGAVAAAALTPPFDGQFLSLIGAAARTGSLDIMTRVTAISGRSLDYFGLDDVALLADLASAPQLDAPATSRLGARGRGRLGCARALVASITARAQVHRDVLKFELGYDAVLAAAIAGNIPLLELYLALFAPAGAAPGAASGAAPGATPENMPGDSVGSCSDAAAVARAVLRSFCINHTKQKSEPMYMACSPLARAHARAIDLLLTAAAGGVLTTLALVRTDAGARARTWLALGLPTPPTHPEADHMRSAISYLLRRIERMPAAELLLELLLPRPGEDRAFVLSFTPKDWVKLLCVIARFRLPRAGQLATQEPRLPILCPDMVAAAPAGDDGTADAALARPDAAAEASARARHFACLRASTLSQAVQCDAEWCFWADHLTHQTASEANLAAGTCACAVVDADGIDGRCTIAALAPQMLPPSVLQLPPELRQLLDAGMRADDGACALCAGDDGLCAGACIGLRDRHDQWLALRVESLRQAGALAGAPARDLYLALKSMTELGLPSTLAVLLAPADSAPGAAVAERWGLPALNPGHFEVLLTGGASAAGTGLAHDNARTAVCTRILLHALAVAVAPGAGPAKPVSPTSRAAAAVAAVSQLRAKLLSDAAVAYNDRVMRIAAALPPPPVALDACADAKRVQELERLVASACHLVPMSRADYAERAPAVRATVRAALAEARLAAGADMAVLARALGVCFAGPRVQTIALHSKFGDCPPAAAIAEELMRAGAPYAFRFQYGTSPGTVLHVLTSALARDVRRSDDARALRELVLAVRDSEELRATIAAGAASSKLGAARSY